MTSKNTEWIEGTKMTTNRNYLKYTAIVEQTATLNEQLKALEAEQNELVLTKIKSFQTIGKSVFMKCCAELYPEREQILGEFSWIFSPLGIKELQPYRISVAKLESRYSSVAKTYVLTETDEVSIPRSYLHMSDRDFAKLIRQKIRKWKDSRRAEATVKLEDELKAAKRALSNAEKAVAKLEARHAERAPKS